MSAPRIIGLTGLEGAGKDTVAAILERHHQVTTAAFADTLRREICAAWYPGLCMADLTCRATKEQPNHWLALQHCADHHFILALAAAGLNPFPGTPQSPRQIMRWWGTEYRRKQDPDYWIKQMRAALAWHASQEQAPACIVITDVRFANEAALVRELGGQIWRIHRPGNDVQSTHISTTTGQEFAPDQTVINAGDLDELERAVLQHWAHAPLYGGKI